MLQIDNYKKAYGGNVVLSISNFRLDKGVYWLKGENGAGKSTLLRSIAGLIPFEGEVQVQNTSLRRQRNRFTQIVSFSEAEPVYPLFLTGLDLLRFYEQTKGRCNEAVHTLKKGLGMQGYLDQKVGTYSSGMLKKLSLLLAFAGKPELILLDEPFITLDVNAVTILQDVISAFSKQGISFIISSHQELTLDANFQILKIHQHTIQRADHVFVAE